MDHLTTCLEQQIGNQEVEKKNGGGLVGVPSPKQVQNKGYLMKNAARTKGA